MPGLRIVSIPPSTSLDDHSSHPPAHTKEHTQATAALTIRLLVPRTGTGTAELLGLASPAIGDQQGAVVLQQGLLQLVLGELIDVFLVVGDDGLGDRLADGIDLRGVATAGDAHADVDFGEALEAEEEDGLVDLEVVVLVCARVCFLRWVCCGRGGGACWRV